MPVITDPTLWSYEGTEPPPQWSEANSRWQFVDTGDSEQRLTYIGSEPLPARVRFLYSNLDTEGVQFNLIYGVDGDERSLGPNTDDSGFIEFDVPTGENFYFGIQFPGELTDRTIALALQDAMNCDCVDETGYETLLDLRERMMRRLGWGAQVANPPPGVADMMDEFLRAEQTRLYRRYSALRTRRFFRWTMQPGVRFYDIADEDNDSCGFSFDPQSPPEWVGVRDLNGAWYPLVAGIPPERYTTLPDETRPYRYEIRQCLEVFPPPDATYELWVKGRFGLGEFTEDTHQTTIDSELVFLFALTAAKYHYGKVDAQQTERMANDYLKDCIAGTHTTKRYVPGGGDMNCDPPTRPILREFIP